MKEIRSLPSEGKREKALKTLGKRFGVREMVFGRGTGADRSREIEEMRTGSQRKNI